MRRATRTATAAFRGCLSWPCAQEFQDVVEREPAALEETDLAGTLAIVVGEFAEPRLPDRLEARGAFRARGAEGTGDGFVVDALGAQLARDLERPEAPRLGTHRLLRVARIREPALLR